MDEGTTLLEAGLGWIVGWDKDRFIGAGPLRAERAAGSTRRLAAFEMIDRGIARHGHPVMADGRPCGVVTSGTQTPFLKKAVGLAMVPIALSAVGATLDIDVRGRACRAVVVKEPFYKRPGKR
jgi:aminomethyltransferase